MKKNIFSRVGEMFTIDSSNPANYIYRIKIKTEKGGKIWYTPQAKVNAWGYMWCNIINAVKRGISVYGDTSINPEMSTSMTESFLEKNDALKAIENMKGKLLEQWNKETVKVEHEIIK